MIAFLVSALSVTLTQYPAPKVAFDAPASVVAGLPLVLPCRIANGGDRELQFELGLNEAAWATVRIVDARGAVAAASLPEVEVPFWRGADYASPYPGTPMAFIRRVTSASRLLFPRIDTTKLAPGRYTLDVSVATTIRYGLPVREGDGPQTFRQVLRYPLEVKSDRAAVKARCEALLEGIHRPVSKGGTMEDRCRELFLADRLVVLPLLRNDRTPWTRYQLEQMAKGLVPYATPDDARVIALYAERSLMPFSRALDLLERSSNPEVVAIVSKVNRGGSASP